MMTMTTPRSRSIDGARGFLWEEATTTGRHDAQRHAKKAIGMDSSAFANEPKLQRLAALFEEMGDAGGVIVCYSGGIDSAFVLAVAHHVLGEKAIGLTAVSPSLASFEREDAVRVAKQIGAKHVLVESHEIDDENYQANNTDRCFFCKSE